MGVSPVKIQLLWRRKTCFQLLLPKLVTECFFRSPCNAKQSFTSSCRQSAELLLVVLHKSKCPLGCRMLLVRSGLFLGFCTSSELY
uniref:Uncharacterized protein n=1 Tax=Arundo donax TaxID=35708 RepID=A0A0A8ZA00_ARUDO